MRRQVVEGMNLVVFKSKQKIYMIQGDRIASVFVDWGITRVVRARVWRGLTLNYTVSQLRNKVDVGIPMSGSNKFE